MKEVTTDDIVNLGNALKLFTDNVAAYKKAAKDETANDQTVYVVGAMEGLILSLFQATSNYRDQITKS